MGRAFFSFFVTSFITFLMIWPLSAQTETKSGPNPETPSFFIQVMPFVVMFLIFYLLVMRPQVKKQRSHQEFLKKLKKGDRVLTNSGIFGTIEGLTDKYVKLEVADKVSIRVLRSHISQSVKEG